MMNDHRLDRTTLKERNALEILGPDSDHGRDRLFWVIRTGIAPRPGCPEHVR